MKVAFLFPADYHSRIKIYPGATTSVDPNHPFRAIRNDTALQYVFRSGATLTIVPGTKTIWCETHDTDQRFPWLQAYDLCRRVMYGSRCKSNTTVAKRWFRKLNITETDDALVHPTERNRAQTQITITINNAHQIVYDTCSEFTSRAHALQIISRILDRFLAVHPLPKRTPPCKTKKPSSKPLPKKVSPKSPHGSKPVRRTSTRRAASS